MKPLKEGDRVKFSFGYGQALVGASGIVCAEPDLEQGTVLVRVAVINCNNAGDFGLGFAGREMTISLDEVTKVETD